jgi:hypothetical protein
MKRVPGSCAVNLKVSHLSYSYLNEPGIDAKCQNFKANEITFLTAKK